MSKHTSMEPQFKKRRIIIHLVLPPGEPPEWAKKKDSLNMRKNPGVFYFALYISLKSFLPEDVIKMIYARSLDDYIFDEAQCRIRHSGKYRMSPNNGMQNLVCWGFRPKICKTCKKYYKKQQRVPTETTTLFGPPSRFKEQYEEVRRLEWDAAYRKNPPCDLHRDDKTYWKTATPYPIAKTSFYKQPVPIAIQSEYRHLVLLLANNNQLHNK